MTPAGDALPRQASAGSGLDQAAAAGAPAASTSAMSAYADYYGQQYQYQQQQQRAGLASGMRHSSSWGSLSALAPARYGATAANVPSPGAMEASNSVAVLRGELQRAHAEIQVLRARVRELEALLAGASGGYVTAGGLLHQPAPQLGAVPGSGWMASRAGTLGTRLVGAPANTLVRESGASPSPPPPPPAASAVPIAMAARSGTSSPYFMPAYGRGLTRQNSLGSIGKDSVGSSIEDAMGNLYTATSGSGSRHGSAHKANTGAGGIIKRKCSGRGIFRNVAGGSKSASQPRYWTEEEHQRYLEALELYGPKDVRAISDHVGTRNPTQVRTHSQKYFLRLSRQAQGLTSKKRSVSEGDLRDAAARESETREQPQRLSPEGCAGAVSTDRKRCRRRTETHFESPSSFAATGEAAKRKTGRHVRHSVPERAQRRSTL
eukprot:ctg_1859.g559